MNRNSLRIKNSPTQRNTENDNCFQQKPCFNILFLEKNDTWSLNTQITVTVCHVWPRSDIDITCTRVNHIGNIKRHKPEITRELFDKYLYTHIAYLRLPKYISCYYKKINLKKENFIFRWLKEPIPLTSHITHKPYTKMTP